MEFALFMGGIAGVTAVIAFIILGSGSSTRDQVLVAAPPDAVLAEVRRWASAFGYKEQPPSPNGAIEFQKGTGALVAATRVGVMPVPGGTEVSAWIKLGVGGKRSMALSKSGFTAKVPRQRALGEFNQLLATFRVAPLVQQ